MNEHITKVIQLFLSCTRDYFFLLKSWYVCLGTENSTSSILLIIMHILRFV